MKTYPYSYDLPLTWHSIQVFDRHPITGSREYERAYLWHFPSSRFDQWAITVKMVDKGWELIRLERFDYGVKRFTWCRKKEK